MGSLPDFCTQMHGDPCLPTNVTLAAAIADPTFMLPWLLGALAVVVMVVIAMRGFGDERQAGPSHPAP